jgi:hypothetical protein
MPPRFLPPLVCCAALCAAAPAGAIPLLTGFGGADGYGTPDHCVAAGNDNSYAAPGATGPTAIDLAPAFPGGLRFFGRTLTRFYLNTNGNITFAAPLSTPTPTPFPIADQPMVAPWWGDVDTRAGGTVCFHLEPTRLVVTWHDVAAAGDPTDRRNDFQLVLSMRPLCERVGDFDVEFRYRRCEWVSGREPAIAQVGFDAGNRMNYVSLPQSRTAAIADVCATSNVPGGAPGLFRFQIRQSTGLRGCFGAGVPCALPGLRGLCGMGVTDCVDGPTARCVQVRSARARGCDGFDNDCDGTLDVGDELCSAGQLCDVHRAACLDRCGPGGRCAAGFVCAPGGGCVEATCLDVSCAPGQRCQFGRCVPICETVHCDAGDRCSVGRCVPACTGVECDAPQVCIADPASPYVGQCGPRCECTPCPADRRCAADGQCVPLIPDAGVPAPDGSPLDAPPADATTPDGAPPDVVPSADVAAPGRLLDAGCGCHAVACPSRGSLALFALAAFATTRRRRRPLP